MLKTKTVTGNHPKAIELGQRFDHTTPVLSSRQMGWNGILVDLKEVEHDNWLHFREL